MPQPSQDSPPAAKLSKKEHSEAALKFLEASKTKLVGLLKPMEGYALDYFRGLEKNGLLPNENLEDLAATSMFPSFKVEQSGSEQIQAVKADQARHMTAIKALASAGNQVPGAEVDDGAEAAAAEAPEEPEPYPEGTLSKRTHIKNCGQKDGVSNGKRWIRFWCVDDEDTWFNTFSRDLGSKLPAFKGTTCTVFYTEAERGNDLIDIQSV